MTGTLAPHRGPRIGNVGRTALLALGLTAVALLLVRLLLGLISYPLVVSSPDMAGIIASKSTNQFDAPEVRLVLTTGNEVILRREDRSLIGGVGEGDLIVFGNTPQRWYLGGNLATRAGVADCYSISADRAYSESDGIVLVWGEWLGAGVRLPKAPGYDDSGLLDAMFGHLEYRPFEFGSGVSFCLDAEGRVTEFTH
ncbi:MAG TPA: hypothetical protein VFO05_00435 [Candidatus Limnocylindrales bacterium]|nr:hypothetical protein [Candidatus Limnocylindrales bacterium]